MVLKKVEPGVWKPEKEGDSITGVFIGMDEGVGEYESNLYHLDVNKEPMGVWGSAGLNPKMIGIKPGNKIKIEYKGTTPSKKGRADTKLFDVYIDDGTDEADASNVPIETPGAPEVPTQ